MNATAKFVIYLPLTPRQMKQTFIAFRDWAKTLGVTFTFDGDEVNLTGPAGWTEERLTALVDKVLIPMLEQVQETVSEMEAAR